MQEDFQQEVIKCLANNKELNKDFGSVLFMFNHAIILKKFKKLIIQPNGKKLNYRGEFHKITEEEIEFFKDSYELIKQLSEKLEENIADFSETVMFSQDIEENIDYQNMNYENIFGEISSEPVNIILETLNNFNLQYELYKFEEESENLVLIGKTDQIYLDSDMIDKLIFINSTCGDFFILPQYSTKDDDDENVYGIRFCWSI